MSDIFFLKNDFALIRNKISHDKIKQGRFTGPIWTNYPKNLSSPYLER